MADSEATQTWVDIHTHHVMQIQWKEPMAHGLNDKEPFENKLFEMVKHWWARELSNSSTDKSLLLIFYIYGKEVGSKQENKSVNGKAESRTNYRI